MYVSTRLKPGMPNSQQTGSPVGISILIAYARLRKGPVSHAGWHMASSTGYVFRSTYLTTVLPQLIPVLWMVKLRIGYV